MLITSSPLFFFIARGGVALILVLFLFGLHLFATSREKAKATEKRYHKFNDRANPALS